MATYLQLHVLKGMTINEVINDGYEEYFCLTDMTTPNIKIAEYSRCWAMLGEEKYPSCVDMLKEMMLIEKKLPLLFGIFPQSVSFIEQYELVFPVLNPKLADKIVNIVSKSFFNEEGQKIIEPDVLREFLRGHMGEKIFLLEL